MNKGEASAPWLEVSQHESDDEVSTSHFSERTSFQVICLVVIILNTVVVAVQACFINNQPLRTAIERCEIAFTCWYVVEIACRLWDEQWSLVQFLSGTRRMWNGFDLVVTVFCVLDVVVDYFVRFGSHGASVVRLFRVLRVWRLCTSMKFMAHVDTVVVQAAKEMVSFGAVVCITLFIAAILCTTELYDSDDDFIAQKFADLGRSMWTLFTLMTMDGWTEVAERIIRDRPYMMLFFCIFIFLSIASMSIVPAIFLETHLSQHEMEKQERTLAMQKEIQSKQEALLRSVFEAMDEDMEGGLTVEALQHGLASQTAVSEEELEEIRLGLFERWGLRPEFDSVSNPIRVMTKDKFVHETFLSHSNVPMAVWRSVTKLRAEMKVAREAQAAEVQELKAAIVREFGIKAAEIKAACGTQAAEVQELKAAIVAELQCLKAAVSSSQESRRVAEEAAEAEASVARNIMEAARLERDALSARAWKLEVELASAMQELHRLRFAASHPPASSVPFGHFANQVATAGLPSAPVETTTRKDYPPVSLGQIGFTRSTHEVESATLTLSSKPELERLAESTRSQEVVSSSPSERLEDLHVESRRAPTSPGFTGADEVAEAPASKANGMVCEGGDNAQTIPQAPIGGE